MYSWFKDFHFLETVPVQGASQMLWLTESYTNFCRNSATVLICIVYIHLFSSYNICLLMFASRHMITCVYIYHSKCSCIFLTLYSVLHCNSIVILNSKPYINCHAMFRRSLSFLWIETVYTASNSVQCSSFGLQSGAGIRGEAEVIWSLQNLTCMYACMHDEMHVLV